MLPDEKIIPNAITVEVPIPTTTARGSNIFFPDVPQIRNKKVCGLCSYTNNEINFALSGNEIFLEDAAAGLYVTLSDSQSNLFVKEIPYLFYSALFFQQELRFFDPPRELAIQKCYLTAVSTVSDGTSALFTIFYL